LLFLLLNCACVLFIGSLIATILSLGLELTRLADEVQLPLLKVNQWLDPTSFLLALIGAVLWWSVACRLDQNRKWARLQSVTLSLSMFATVGATLLLWLSNTSRY
jgi:uncharacterized membrane protein